jgi:hypothetical protein
MIKLTIQFNLKNKSKAMKDNLFLAYHLLASGSFSLSSPPELLIGELWSISSSPSEIEESSCIMPDSIGAPD